MSTFQCVSEVASPVAEINAKGLVGNPRHLSIMNCLIVMSVTRFLIDSIDDICHIAHLGHILSGTVVYCIGKLFKGLTASICSDKHDIKVYTSPGPNTFLTQEIKFPPKPQTVPISSALAISAL